MIDLYTWGTPNGRKVSILLEELGLPHRAIPVNLTKAEQTNPDFVAISPNAKIPAIVDHDNDGLTLMESGAILMYLAERERRFLPASGPARAKVLEWLMWQMGGFGPMIGQTHHFLDVVPGKAPYAEARFQKETLRLYGVLERQLTSPAHVAGDDYSIADMAIWPWVARYQRHRVDLAAFSAVLKWYLTLADRPAVIRGYDQPVPTGPIPRPESAVAKAH